MVDFLASVESDRGPIEPIPVTIVSGGAEVSLSGGSDPAVAQRLGDTSNPANGTVNQRLAALNASIGLLPQAGGTQAISAASLPLPTGAATSAAQNTGNASLSSLDGRLGPTSGASGAITPISGLGVTSLVLKAAAGNFYSASITAGATAGFLIAYNASIAPAASASLSAALILNAVAVNANGLASLGGNPVPDRFSSGITLLFSTSLATYSVPTNAATFMRGSAL